MGAHWQLYMFNFNKINMDLLPVSQTQSRILQLSSMHWEKVLDTSQWIFIRLVFRPALRLRLANFLNIIND